MSNPTAAEAYKIHAKEERRKAARKRVATGEAAAMKVEREEARRLQEAAMYTADGRRRVDAIGRNNENKRGRKAA